MKYKYEIDKMFEDVLRESWMDDQDWQFIKKEMESNPKFDLMQFEKDIDTGIKNGYTLEFQLKLCKDILTKMKEDL